jgi:hypothetical protein
MGCNVRYDRRESTNHLDPLKRGNILTYARGIRKINSLPGNNLA